MFLNVCEKGPSASTERESSSAIYQVTLSVKAILSVCTFQDKEYVHGLPKQENSMLAFEEGSIICLP